MNIYHMTAKNGAKAFLVASTLLASLPAMADESNGADHPARYTSQDPVLCDSLVSNNLFERQTRWECWEPATGYVRTTISSTSLENHENNGLQSAFFVLRSGVKVALSKWEWPWTERLGMLSAALDSPQIRPTSR